MSWRKNGIIEKNIGQVEKFAQTGTSRTFRVGQSNVFGPEVNAGRVPFRHRPPRTQRRRRAGQLYNTNN
jgi:hypothetical protein